MRRQTVPLRGGTGHPTHYWRSSRGSDYADWLNEYIQAPSAWNGTVLA